MRITGGKFRGRKIFCPPGIIRPSMDKMREAVFSSLGTMDGLSFLDLFSGSGIIAMEAASRGASRVHAVERDARKRDMLQRNLDIADEYCSFSISPVERFILKRQEKFDIVFLDPPFPYRHRRDLLHKLCMSALLRQGSAICIHFPAEDNLEIKFSGKSIGIELEKRKDFGRSRVHFYRADIRNTQ